MMRLVKIISGLRTNAKASPEGIPLGPAEQVSISKNPRRDLPAALLWQARLSTKCVGEQAGAFG
jgi:hypothetical protein